MVDYVVTGHGIGRRFPYLVATARDQHEAMVDALLSPPLAEPEAHYGAYFYLGDIPAYADDAQGQVADSWLRIGLHRGHGGAYFYYQGERKGEDWSWIALPAESAESTSDAATVYFDRGTQTVFPAKSVMPVKRLRELVLEWIDSGRPPGSVRWQPVNGLVWQVTDDGEVEPG